MAKNKKLDSKAQSQLPQKDQPEASPDVTAQSDNKSAVEAKPLFPIVGIGASAGGLAAFEAFFKAMPADFQPGMAFVLVQHLAPNHKSLLTELIKEYSVLPVFEIEDGLTVEPDTIYIIPPNHWAFDKAIDISKFAK